MNQRVTTTIMAALAALLAAATLATAAAPEGMTFPEGTATPSETCGACHKAIYREFAFGFGSDIHYQPTTIPSKPGEKLVMPAKVAATATGVGFTYSWSRLSAAASSLLIGALLVEGVGAVVLLISGAWLGVALIIATLGPKTNAMPLEVISR